MSNDFPVKGEARGGISPGATRAIPAPSRWLTMAEPWRAGFEALGLFTFAPLMALAPNGDGHAVLVLRGFATSDHATALLRRFLVHRGYDARSWDLGWNLDHKTVGEQGELIAKRIAALHAESGRTISLVGWSLGGVIAREAARRMPDEVRNVITLGSPFAGDPRANAVGRLYERLSGNIIDTPATLARYAHGHEPLRVPSTAVFSRTDGIAAWRNCIGAEDDINENLEVVSSHFGLIANPAVLHLVADRLAQPEAGWRRFVRPRSLAFLYPDTAIDS